MKKILVCLLASMTIMSLTACQETGASSEVASEAVASSEVASSEAVTEEVDTVIDLAGNEITLPAEVDKIISLAPSNTEVIVGLGKADMLVAVDKYSAEVEGVAEGLPLFDIMTPDTEQIIAMGADIILTTGMSNSDGNDVFKPLTDAGVLVITIPSAASIDEIYKTIELIGDVTNTEDKAATMVTDMKTEIEAIRAKSTDIAEKKTVYFEVAPGSNLYSLGNGTFINEMIEVVGCVNVFADQEGWLPISEEAVIDSNPDIIMSKAGYIEDPVADILARANWGSITAIKNGDVYYIDEASSSRGSQNIIKALKEMAVAAYPEIYTAE